MVEFNKMFVMLPVMLAARKLDGEDPKVLHLIRITYGVVQTFSILVVLYTYFVASAVKSDTIIYVPPAATPFADPNAKKKYTEILFRSHCHSTARSLLGSTLFGILMTVGFHYYKGMVMGLAIQMVMAPFNLIENPLVKALFWSSTRSIRQEDKIFGEKSVSELLVDDEVVDEHGNSIIRRPASTSTQIDSNKTKSVEGKVSKATLSKRTQREKPLEEIMLDTWDEGAKADLSVLMNALTAGNVNTTTSEDKWTPLMILAGLKSSATPSAIRNVLALGADVTLTDVEGWNCLHWAGFHGSILAAKELCTETDLLGMKDKEGNTPSATARKEGNTSVAEIFDSAYIKKDKKKEK